MRAGRAEDEHVVLTDAHRDKRQVQRKESSLGAPASLNLRGTKACRQLELGVRLPLCRLLTEGLQIAVEVEGGIVGVGGERVGVVGVEMGWGGWKGQWKGWKKRALF